MTTPAEAEMLAARIFDSLDPGSARLSASGGDTFEVVIGDVHELFSVDLDDAPGALAWKLADRIQTILMESGQTMIPPCPRHPNQHPMESALSDRTAVWRCPSTREVVRPVL